jgi:microsomal epoxide hydrolase
MCPNSISIGSFLELLPILSILKKQYTPDQLPYHYIVLSLPGYAFSTPPPLTRDSHITDIARIMNTLMIQLGFGGGYVAQGGEIGSKVARILAAEHDKCRGKLPDTPSVDLV